MWVSSMGNKEVLSSEYAVMIITGIAAGFIARVITLVVDKRQIPTLPNGVFINMVTGFIAAALGAVAIPALILQDFTAITFLALAIQHFRDIRKVEFDSLIKLDHVGYSKRGEAYIDGIAKTYEARLYMSLVTAVATVLAMLLVRKANPILQIALGLATGLIATMLMKHYTKGKSVGDICEIRQGKVRVEGSELYVDDIFVTNTLGTMRSREMFEKQGLGVVITPKDEMFHITLDNYGQREAILFEASQSLGVKRFSFSRKSYSRGVIVIALVPIVGDIDVMIEAIKGTPILESSRKIRRIMNARQGGKA